MSSEAPRYWRLRKFLYRPFGESLKDGTVVIGNKPESIKPIREGKDEVIIYESSQQASEVLQVPESSMSSK